MPRIRAAGAVLIGLLGGGCGKGDAKDTHQHVGGPDTGGADTGCEAPMPVWWPDNDGDTHGASAGAVAGCVAPEGYVSSANDCDDNDPETHPGALERCDDLDQDCDGVVDNAAADAEVWYLDRDGDGFGDPDLSTADCTAPQGYVANPDDCDDGDRDVSPSGQDICDERDGDCDGVTETCPGTTTWTPTDAAYTWNGTETYGYAGERLATPDLDGDGLQDLIVGAGLSDHTANGNEGAAYVVYGATSLAGGDLTTGWRGCEVGHQLSSSVANAGDVDGDGIDDAVLGSPGDDSGETDAGAVWLVYGGVRPTDNTVRDIGSVGTRLKSVTAYEFAGTGVFGPGDVNGDGFADLLVGGPGHDNDEDGEPEGIVRLLLGRSGGWTGTLNLDTRPSWPGVGGLDGLGGQASLGGGDLDGDGIADLVMGAPGWDLTSGDDQAGAVWVVLGDAGGWLGEQSLMDAEAQIAGPSIGARAAFGQAVAVAGDTDADGYNDLVVGAPWSETDAADGGAAYIFLGASTWVDAAAEDADAEVQGASDWGYLGAEVAPLGDVDGDGHSDIGLGAVGSNDPETAAGAAWLLPGGVALGIIVVSDLPLVIRGAEADSFLGTSMANGDLDGDGVLEVVVGGPGTNTGGGSVWAFSGWGE